MSQTPKPCPFCGEPEVAMYPNAIATAGYQMGVPGTDSFYGHCPCCGAEGPQCDSESQAIAAWNTRASLPSEQPVRQTDTERLDWLDRQRNDITDDDNSSDGDQRLVGHAWGCYGQYDTIREAIDTARNAAN